MSTAASSPTGRRAARSAAGAIAGTTSERQRRRGPAAEPGPRLSPMLTLAPPPVEEEMAPDLRLRLVEQPALLPAQASLLGPPSGLLARLPGRVGAGGHAGHGDQGDRHPPPHLGLLS